MLSWGKKSSKSAVDATPIHNTTKTLVPVKLADPQPGTYDRSDIIPPVRTAATEDDLKWQLLAGCNETFTFYMTLEGGVFAFVQMTYSAMGLSPNVGVTCRVYYPDGTKECKTINHGTSSFKLTDSNLSATCEEMSIKYNHATQGYTVQFNISKDTVFNVEYIPADCAGTFKVGNGRVYFGKGEKDGFVQAAFMPKAKVTGTVVLKGKSVACEAEGLFHHAIQCKPQNVQKWNFVNFQSEEDALMLYEFELPKNGHSDLNIVSQGCIVHKGRTLAITTNNRAVHVQQEFDALSKYDIPTQMFLSWHGKTLEDGLDVSVELSTLLTNKLEMIDVLAELPFLLRKFIQAFITAPFIFSWYEKRIVAKVTVGDDKFEIEGNAFVECSFLSRD
ncbi:putative cell survival pathways protein [Podochytrium sp. JEL0797]|nr:putative cell survival pathways protein [Podochytrium sp. JEL0797]